MANVHGMPVDMLFGKGEEPETKKDDQPINMSKEQYGNVMTMLHHFPMNSLGEHTNNLNLGNGSMNFAGIVVCTSSIDFGKPSCRHFESKSNLWILHLGASDHMSFNRLSMTNIKTLPYPILISLPNRYRVKVIELGDVILTPKII